MTTSVKMAEIRSVSIFPSKTTEKKSNGKHKLIFDRLQFSGIVHAK